MDRIDILPKDEVHRKIDCDKGLAQELSDYFTFEVPGAKFMPSYKNRMWDGKIRLFNTASHTLYKGLVRRVEKFCQDRDYECVVHGGLNHVNDIPLNELEEFFEGKYTPRDYQLRAIAHALRIHRAVILSPTASGKSFIIYCIIRYLLTHGQQKALVIVPTTSLVHQMNTDFIEYSENQQFYYTHLIMEGQEKNNDEAQIFISTWQSIYKQPKKWFDQFDVVIGDEAHQFKATSLTKIMTKMDNCKYRFGLTGTLDGTQTNKLVLEGLFGSVMKVVHTKELIEKGTLSDFRIKCLVLKYPEGTCKQMKQSNYQDEIQFLIANDNRNKFIKNLALTREGNSLVLYQMVEKHGEVLYNEILASAKDKEVYFVHGGIDATTREDIRHRVEQSKNAIIVASYGTFSTGINIRNLHNIIFASPSKSRIRNLQSIGRALRKGDNKEVATLYDIADDLTYKSWNNHTIKHFAERVKIYNEEEFDYKIYNIGIADE
ncbi:MAG: DEAD/DEAH box helicase family protein [Candidatus Poseidoniales archaeon]